MKAPSVPPVMSQFRLSPSADRSVMLTGDTCQLDTIWSDPMHKLTKRWQSQRLDAASFAFESSQMASFWATKWSRQQENALLRNKHPFVGRDEVSCRGELWTLGITTKHRWQPRRTCLFFVLKISCCALTNIWVLLLSRTA